MKKVLSILAIVAILAGAQSCENKKCGACEVGGVKGTKLCEKDSQAAYDAAKDACEKVGGKWVTE
jgi:hypothetical protein